MQLQVVRHDYIIAIMLTELESYNYPIVPAEENMNGWGELHGYTAHLHTQREDSGIVGMPW